MLHPYNKTHHLMEVFQTMVISYITNEKAGCKIQDTKHKTQDIPYFVSHFNYLFFIAFCFLCNFYIGSTFAQNYEEQDFIPPSELKQSFDPDAKSYSAVSKSIYWEHQTSVDASSGNQIGIQADYRESANYLNEAIQLDPRSSFLHTKLAELYIAQKDYETARTEIDNALELNQSNANAHYLSGYIKSMKIQDRPGAIEEFKKAAELDPDHYNAQRLLGVLAFDFGNYKLAANAYSQLVRLRPYEPSYRYRLGVAYSESGETGKAIEEYKTAIMLDENNMESHYGLAYLYSAQGRNKEAIEECLFILKLVPNNSSADVMVLLAQLYFAEGEYDKAISISEGILKGRGGSKKNIADAYYRLGTVYKEKGERNLSDVNFQKSIDVYKTLLEENAKNIELNYDIAIVYDAKGDYDLAEKYLQRYIVLKPNESKAYNYLGYMLIEQNKTLDKAVVYIEKALTLEPNNGTIHDSLGWAYFKLGKIDKAISELEKAVELTPSDSDIREHLGEAYLKKGGELTNKAAQEWEKALELRPSKTALQRKLSDLKAKLGSNTEK
jgi:tetratricopeptide (TPR) repeat protein